QERAIYNLIRNLLDDLKNQAAREQAIAAANARSLLAVAALENLLWGLLSALGEMWGEDVGGEFYDHFPGLVQNFIQTPTGHQIVILLFPHDPNALVGPAGYGAQGFVGPAASLPYTVDFENDGSVAAQDVTVTEQLGSNFHWSTFQLGSFG